MTLDYNIFEAYLEDGLRQISKDEKISSNYLDKLVKFYREDFFTEEVSKNLKELMDGIIFQNGGIHISLNDETARTLRGYLVVCSSMLYTLEKAIEFGEQRKLRIF